jgi:two-component system, NtrC family, response regulator AtoC
MKPGDHAVIVTPQMLQGLGELISEKEFSSVSPEAFAVLARQSRALSLADRSTFHFLYARYLYIHGDYCRARARVRCAVRLCRAGSDHVLFARAKHLSGIICQSLGRMDEAAEQFLEAFVSHKRACNNQAACLPLTSLGLLHLYTGDLAQARRVLSDALSYAEKFSSLSRVHTCMYDLFIVDMLSGRLQECRTTLKLIRSQPLSTLDDALRTRFGGQLAVWLLDTREAHDQLCRAMVVFAREKLRRDTVVCLEYLGMNEYFAGNYAKAKEYYQKVLDMPEPTASAVAQTLRMLTDVYIAEGNWKEAKETAVKAEAAITKINERIELAALWRAQAEIAEHDRNHDVARDFFQKSIDLLQQCGARYELALTHFAAGQSTVYPMATRSEHLQQAKTLFVEMDVPKRVAQTLSALAKLEPLQLKYVHSDESTSNPEIVTQNTDMLRILGHAAKFAVSDMTILITGETGTGKDLLAKRIHYLSKRAAGPYCNHNMARLPRELADSELFGYEKNSHSRAEQNRAGLIESAHGGTLCLNEVAELPLEMQSKLLLALEEKSIWRVGGHRAIPIDVRYIAITNSDLRKQVDARQFREDLFFRLQPGHLHLPPLRERKDDLPLLLQFFLKRLEFGEYDLEQTTLIVERCGLDGYNWPGNVRELENLISRSVVLTSMPNVAGLICSLSDILEQQPRKIGDDCEYDKLMAVLKRNKGNKSKTAEELGIPESTLRRHLRKFNF